MIIKTDVLYQQMMKESGVFFIELMVCECIGGAL